MTQERAAQALVFSPDSGTLRVRTITVRSPEPGEVRVRVGASGVCHSDLHVLNGDWPCRDQLVLGHEAAGSVESVGDGVERVSEGDRVVLSWVPPCGACAACVRQLPWLCAGSKSSEHRLAAGDTAFDVDGQAVYPFLGIGGFSEYVVVPEQAAIPVPDALPYDVGALIGCCVATGVGAVRNIAEVPPGATALVLGCGGVGQSTIAGLSLAAARSIVAVDISEQRRSQALAGGATTTLSADELDRNTEQYAVDGFDFVFETVGAAETIGQAVELVRPGGTVILEGLTAAGETVPVDVYDVVASGKRILGCNYGASIVHRDFPRLAAEYLDGSIRLDHLLGERIGLGDVNDAFEDMRAGRGARAMVTFA